MACGCTSPLCSRQAQTLSSFPRTKVLTEGGGWGGGALLPLGALEGCRHFERLVHRLLARWSTLGEPPGAGPHPRAPTAGRQSRSSQRVATQLAVRPTSPPVHQRGSGASAPPAQFWLVGGRGSQSGIRPASALSGWEGRLTDHYGRGQRRSTGPVGSEHLDGKEKPEPILRYTEDPARGRKFLPPQSCE